MEQVTRPEVSKRNVSSLVGRDHILFSNSLFQCFNASSQRAQSPDNKECFAAARAIFNPCLSEISHSLTKNAPIFSNTTLTPTSDAK